MFTKATLALSALLIVGATSVAFADEDPENKIGDRYPFLEQQYRATSGNGAAQSMPQHPKLPQYNSEDVENKIADRYPLLEQPIQAVTTASKPADKIARKVMPFTVAEKVMFDHESARSVF